ncbi:MAG: tyrosine--tRNA ligase [Planctomycetales bacterium]|nr:tyrosine--tRNA ligase [Planctomycetales bacterium]
MQNPCEILSELHWRGLIHQQTEAEGLRKLLESPQFVYAGFDPTASSLHCGSLLPLMMLRRFQQFGHCPIALVGGATGMIGDPSGKSEERVLLSSETLQANVEGMQQQMRQFLDFSGPQAATLVNNYDWMRDWSYIDFLRDVGKNFPVNVMLAKDSVRSRLERQDSGISYTEFSYMLLQAYDFAHLHQSHKCTLQIGGSDQWGNITAGIDLARRMYGAQLHGLTCPLLLTSDGRKMGKTEGGAIWLDAKRTSPFAFYQYWFNTEDADVLMCLRFLTEIGREEYQALEETAQAEPHLRAAQKRLASWLTEFVHGAVGLQTAIRASEVLFGAEVKDLSDHELLEIFDDVPSCQISYDVFDLGVPIIEAFLQTGLVKSKTEGRRLVDSGGCYINNLRIADAEYCLTKKDLASESVIVLRSGKKKFALMRVLN